MENSRNTAEKEEAKLQAESEKLRANLLRSISHDLRTPLTAISGNASILLSDSENLDFDARKQMYGDIYDDSAWLHNLVENLLAVTKIEEGRMELKTQPQLAEEIVSEAMQHISRKRSEHTITKEKGVRYLEMTEGYCTRMALDENNEVIGYEFVSLGKMTDMIKKGMEPNEAYEKAKGTYGRFNDAAKYIDPRKE